LLHKSEQLQEELETITQAETERIAQKIKGLEKKVAALEIPIAKERFLIQVSSLFQQWYAQLQLLYFKWAGKLLISIRTKAMKREMDQCTKLRDGWTQNKEEEIQKRCGHELNELDHAKEVVDQLALLIPGAIGENKVVSALKDLSDENTLINDYSLSFKRPIHRKSEGDRIFSIQLTTYWSPEQEYFSLKPRIGVRIPLKTRICDRPLSKSCAVVLPCSCC